jgi:uncharacterized membrane protein
MVMDDSTHSAKDKESESVTNTNLEHLWQFAGQGLSSSEFNTAMVHFYRGEMSRSNVWRERLDATTNWAVITTGASLTFAFSGPGNEPTVLIAVSLLVLLFLFIEARRYRYYELWTYRVRIMETNFFAGLLSPPFLPHTDWAQKVTDSLSHPRFPISLLEAFGRRYRRNYAPIFLLLALSWIGKIYIHPTPMTYFTWREFLQRSAVGPIPGWFVLAAGLVFNGVLIAIGLFTVVLRESEAEVLGETPGGMASFIERLRMIAWEVLETDLPRLTRLDTRKQLAYIISDEVQKVGEALLSELERGVTLLKGRGMYTGEEHGVLMCALQAQQLSTLRKVVQKTDPDAFVIVTPAHDVRGQGFRPLEA